MMPRERRNHLLHPSWNLKKAAASRAAPLTASNQKSPSVEEIVDEEAYSIINPPLDPHHILEASDGSDNDVDTHTQKQSHKTAKARADDVEQVEIVEIEEVEEDNEAKLSLFLPNISIVNF